MRVGIRHGPDKDGMFAIGNIDNRDPGIRLIRRWIDHGHRMGAKTGNLDQLRFELRLNRTHGIGQGCDGHRAEVVVGADGGCGSIRVRCVGGTIYCVPHIKCISFRIAQTETNTVQFTHPTDLTITATTTLPTLRRGNIICVTTG